MSAVIRASAQRTEVRASRASARVSSKAIFAAPVSVRTSSFLAGSMNMASAMSVRATPAVARASTVVVKAEEIVSCIGGFPSCLA